MKNEAEWRSKCNDDWKRYAHSPVGKVIGGFIVIAVGAILLARQLGVAFPEWLFTWPVLLITLGLYIGARHLFRNPGWIVMVMIGGIFLVDELVPTLPLTTYLWPLLIIFIGLIMIFKSKKRGWEHHDHHHARWNRHKKMEEMFGNEKEADPNTDAEEKKEKVDYLESISVFGGIKKNILSKKFKGGEIVCVMGGAEINLSQADIEGRVELEIVQFLGGTKLIIPSHWDVQPQIVAVLGGIEDKRQLNSNISPDKILVIRGTSVLGGIEIQSF